MRVRAPMLVRPATTTWLTSSTPVAELDVAADHAEGTDLDVLGKLGARLDDGGRMHLSMFWHHPDPESWR